MQQTPQALDFGAGPFPVLLGKSVEGQAADAQAGAGFNRHTNGLYAGLVTSDAGQAAAAGPAAVAVHDHGEVLGQTLGDERGGELPFPGPGLQDLQQSLHVAVTSFHLTP